MHSLSLYAYGSLQLENVFSAVTGLHCEGLPAALKDYQCHHLKGFSFPAIVPCAGGKVSGHYYPGLSSAVFQRIDAFEDDFYVRRTVRVMVEGLGARLAEVYVLKASSLWRLGEAGWTLKDLSDEAVAGLLGRL